jgi:hypothetical protein
MSNWRGECTSQCAVPRHGPESPDLESSHWTNESVDSQTVCRVRTDRLSRGWLRMLHQPTDCAGRGWPEQCPATVYRAHRADALFVGTKPTTQFCRRTDL